MGSGPIGVCQESKDIDYVLEGGTCGIIAGKVCLEDLNCHDGICCQMGAPTLLPKAELVPADVACAAAQVCVTGYQ